jgi:hypothetical protein
MQTVDARTPLFQELCHSAAKRSAEPIRTEQTPLRECRAFSSTREHTLNLTPADASSEGSTDFARSRNGLGHQCVISAPPMTVKARVRRADTALVDRDVALPRLPCWSPANSR